MTPQQQRLIELVRAGAGVTEAAAAVGAHRSAPSRWTKSNPEFAVALQSAKALQSAPADPLAGDDVAMTAALRTAVQIAVASRDAKAIAASVSAWSQHAARHAGADDLGARLAAASPDELLAALGKIGDVRTWARIADAAHEREVGQLRVDHPDLDDQHVRTVLGLTMVWLPAPLAEAWVGLWWPVHALMLDHARRVAALEAHRLVALQLGDQPDPHAVLVPDAAPVVAAAHEILDSIDPNPEHAGEVVH